MIQIQNYNSNILTLRNENLIALEDIHDFRSLPEAKSFQDSFNFYQGTVIKHYNYKIEPGIVFFNPNMNVNAKATRHPKGYYLMSINKGVIFKLIKLFRDNDDLFKAKALIQYNTLSTKSNYPLNELMYQICGHFTFYHELAHLIQKAKLLETGLAEDLEIRNKFNLDRHVLEYDADIFSAICIGLVLASLT